MLRTTLVAGESLCRRRAWAARWLAAACLTLAAGAPLPCQAGIAGLELMTPLVGGPTAPMFSLIDPANPNRMFIGERSSPANSTNATAVIRTLDLTTKTFSATSLLTIPGLDNRSEGGLLGMAFHPDYATNGKFYVNVTAPDSISGTAFSTYIRQYTVPAPASATPQANPTALPIMTFGQPQDNHNGGWIGFGPDGYLYIMSGDGGGGYDTGTGHVEPTGNAQDITDNLLGKALRIDVNAEGANVSPRDDFPADAARNYRIPDSNPFADVRNANRVVTSAVTGDDEIWAYGLRNPFRAGFDRATGELWIGDVGQDQREEIDLQPASSDGGENYGWRLREGTGATPGNVGGPKPTGAIDPVYEYFHGSLAPNQNFEGVSVVGGLPYRGPDPTLQGKYFFADTSRNRYWLMTRTVNQTTNVETFSVAHINSLLTPDAGSTGSPVSFNEDASGNIYITMLNGRVYRIKTNALTPGDFNADARVDAADLQLWQTGFGMTAGALPRDGDSDGDGDVDGNDFVAWQRNLGWSALNVGSVPLEAVPEPGTLALAAVVGMALAGAARRGLRE